VPDPDRLASGPVIHPTAAVHPGAALAADVEIGPYAVIEEHVEIAEGTVVGPHGVIHRDVILGRGNRLAAHVVLGGRPQDKAYRGERTRVVIGDNNFLSEFVSVDRATGEGQETRIGNATYIMSGVKISHNCTIDDGATIVSGSQLGGWVHVDEHAYLGGMSGVHQFVHVGRLAMIAGHTGARQDVPPYVMAAGFQARIVGLNLVGLRRHSVSAADRMALRRAFRTFFQSGLALDDAIRNLEEEAAGSPPVRQFLDFILASRQRNRGIARWRPQTDQ
jgi:UDP-N-acetylglucosamine acyltransferase